MTKPEWCGPERDLTWEERATWGLCAVCQAGPGVWCRAEVGLHPGAKADGSKLLTGEGVHMVRIQRAPMRVQTVGIS